MKMEFFPFWKPLDKLTSYQLWTLWPCDKEAERSTTQALTQNPR